MNKTEKWILVFSTILILIFQSENGVAQSLTGTIGLVTIPTAEMPKDREISFGLNYYHKKYFVYGDNYHAIAGFITLGYLPFLEITPRLSRPLNYAGPKGLGDRTVSIRLRPFRENKLFPSIVLGVHDPIGTRHCNAFYLVTSKSFRLSNTIKTGIHLGYGVDWIKAQQHDFVGLFGGISLSPSPFITLMLEHGTEKFNCGMRMSILDQVEILLAFLNFDTFSGGISYKFSL